MLAGSLRGIISQRLLVRSDGKGRIPAVEAMVVTGRIRDLILDPAQTHQIHTAIQEGDYYGMQTFDQSLLSLFERGMVSLEWTSYMMWPVIPTTSRCWCHRAVMRCRWPIKDSFRLNYHRP
jgi:Tfp pilus assembly pilus retraction ATPase PilT